MANSGKNDTCSSASPPSRPHDYSWYHHPPSYSACTLDHVPTISQGSKIVPISWAEGYVTQPYVCYYSSHFTMGEAKALATHASKGQKGDSHPSLSNPTDAAFHTWARTQRVSSLSYTEVWQLVPIFTSQFNCAPRPTPPSVFLSRTPSLAHCIYLNKFQLQNMCLLEIKKLRT